MGRLPQLDALRGLAVLAMLTWHSADSWLQAGLRSGPAWPVLRAVGGLAAPLFLVVAGAGASLAAARDPAGQRVWARGLELGLLGYALRLQTWLIDTGALWDLGMLRAWMPLAAGYALLWWWARQLSQGRPSPHLALAGAALSVTGLAQVDAVDPGRLQPLLRPDVLQAIGLSLVVLGALLQRHPAARPGLLGAGALAWALLSPTAGRWLALSALPESLAALLVATPGGAPFPLLPWLSYALAGAAGARFMWPAAGHARPQAARGLAWGVLGVALATACAETHGYMYLALQAHPALTHLARCSFHLGEIAVLSCVLGALAQLPIDPTRGLQQLGRGSLVVYWTHLVFVYGVMANPLKGRLDHAQWGATLLGLVLAMWMLSQVRPPRARIAAHT